MEALSLYELNQLIRSVIEGAMPQTFLVTAEIASFSARRHCYMTLVDKEEGTARAEMNAVIWANRYSSISSDFRDATGVALAKGIKILFEASVSFHERYGLKLDITNIDPSYTIGELAVKRKEILERLSKEGLKDKNSLLEFPLVPQRIGIISSPTAAGYEDLMTHLTDNPYGYNFNCRLYEAIMQGDNAEASIVRALAQCRRESSTLDIVVIVRGGGGEFDLHCFDSYEIAKTIALMPLPVISGIGHERNVTVVDEVAGIRGKTPTAVADLIITRVKEFEESVRQSAYRLIQGVNKHNADSEERLAYLSKGLMYSKKLAVIQERHIQETAGQLKGLISGKITAQDGILDRLFSVISTYSEKMITFEYERLKERENNLNHLDPQNVLKRGYSITYKDGSALKSALDVKKNDKLRTVLHTGEIFSRSESTKIGENK